MHYYRFFFFFLKFQQNQKSWKEETFPYLQNKLEALSLLDKLGQVFGTFKLIVNVSLKAFITLVLPHDPQLQDVILAATLNGLVAGVVGDIVKLVLLEQIRGISRVALLKQTLEK